MLVVGHNRQALNGYVEFLDRAGFAVSGSSNGVEALGIALETTPDVIVTDMLMPDLDGFALAAALGADPRTRHIPLVGMTGHWTTDIQREALASGFSAMLLKPCSPMHLLAELERVLRHARLTSAAWGAIPGDIRGPLPVGLGNAVRRRGVAEEPRS